MFHIDFDEDGFYVVSGLGNKHHNNHTPIKKDSSISEGNIDHHTTEFVTDIM